MLDGSYFFESKDCTSNQTLKFVLDKGYYVSSSGAETEHEKPELYMSIFLSTGEFFHRLKKGIKYIFGYKCSQGHFGSWTLCEKDIGKLSYLLADYKEVLDEYNLKNKVKKA